MNIGDVVLRVKIELTTCGFSADVLTDLAIRSTRCRGEISVCQELCKKPLNALCLMVLSFFLTRSCKQIHLRLKCADESSNLYRIYPTTSR